MSDIIPTLDATGKTIYVRPVKKRKLAEEEVSTKQTVVSNLPVLAYNASTNYVECFHGKVYANSIDVDTLNIGSWTTSFGGMTANQSKVVGATSSVQAMPGGGSFTTYVGPSWFAPGMATNGDSLEIMWVGTITNTAVTKALRLLFMGTAMTALSLPTSVASGFRCSLLIFRASATTINWDMQLVVGSVTNSTSGTGTIVNSMDVNLNFALQVQNNGVAGDVTCTGATIKYIPNT